MCETPPPPHTHTHTTHRAEHLFQDTSGKVTLTEIIVSEVSKREDIDSFTVNVFLCKDPPNTSTALRIW